MISRYSVLRGSYLEKIDNNLLILDVSYQPPKYDQQRHEIAGLPGYDEASKVLRELSVTITFELHIYDIVKRQAVLQKVIQWAKVKGRKMYINDRSPIKNNVGDYYLEAELSDYPSIASVRNWTAPLSLTFTTVGIPYWQNTTLTQLELSGKTASGSMTVPGTGDEALVSVTVTAKEKITKITLQAGSTKIVLEKISVAKDKKIELTYTNGRFLSIKVDKTSLLNKVTAASSDNLKVSCNTKATIKVDASGKVSATFTARGLWV